VGDTPPIVRRGEILLAVQLLAAEHVPQAEFRFQPSIVLPGDRAADERLRIDDAPALKRRHRIDAGEGLCIGRRIDHVEQAAALQIGSDDLGHAICRVAVARRAGDEFRDRNGNRLEFTAWSNRRKAGLRSHTTRRERQANRAKCERTPSCEEEPLRHNRQ